MTQSLAISLLLLITSKVIRKTTSEVMSYETKLGQIIKAWIYRGHAHIITQ